MYNPTSPTVNFPIKTPTDRLTFYMRGGRPAFYFHSKFRYGEPNWMGDVDLVATDNASMNHAASLIAQAAKEYADLADLQLVYMKDYLFHDNGVEEAVYCDGTRIVGNFSEKEQAYGGTVLPPFGYAVLR
jgi:hypothetical protein